MSNIYKSAKDLIDLIEDEYKDAVHRIAVKNRNNEDLSDWQKGELDILTVLMGSPEYTVLQKFVKDNYNIRSIIKDKE